MKLELKAFEYFLTSEYNSHLVNEKLFGILLLDDNGELTEHTILEEDFNKYHHILLTDEYPNIEDIRSKIPQNTLGYPIVMLK
jgi:hypothetical protein